MQTYHLEITFFYILYYIYPINEYQIWRLIIAREKRICYGLLSLLFFLETYCTLDRTSVKKTQHVEYVKIIIKFNK